MATFSLVEPSPADPPPGTPPGGAKIIEVGDGVVVGFLGATPVARQGVRAAATTNAQAITLANDLRAALIALGLVQ